MFYYSYIGKLVHKETTLPYLCRKRREICIPDQTFASVFFLFLYSKQTVYSHIKLNTKSNSMIRDFIIRLENIAIMYRLLAEQILLYSPDQTAVVRALIWDSSVRIRHKDPYIMFKLKCLK